MKIFFLLAFIAVTTLSLSTWAADEPKAPEKSVEKAGPSKESREKMAVAHEAMAACLRSEQDLKQCHETLHKSCESAEGESCPMHKKGGRKGMKRGK